MTTEDKAPISNQAAQISLTDCLACSGCVTSAEAVLVSLQSHLEVVNALSSYRSVQPRQLHANGLGNGVNWAIEDDGMVFVASVSPQSRASLAAAYGVSKRTAGHMIEQMLSGPDGIRKSGRYGAGFTWTLDTNVARELCLVLGADEVMRSLREDSMPAKKTNGHPNSIDEPTRPILTSACPGWICYAEKTHPYVLPHLSRLKSPQALLGTMIKTTLSRRLGITPDRIWHLAVMPCFDKKLEASREELTDISWKEDKVQSQPGVRDVDCVITTKEILSLADSLGIRFSDLSPDPTEKRDRTSFPDSILDHFFFAPAPQGIGHEQRQQPGNGDSAAGTSGGYLHHILQTYTSQHPGSEIRTTRGRNADIVEHSIVAPKEASNNNNEDEEVILLRTARYYGFRNIQNLVRKLKPAKASRMPGAVASRARLASRQQQPSSSSGIAAADVSRYAYVEVMACPGGCTNGGGQIKVDEVPSLRSAADHASPPAASDDDGHDQRNGDSTTLSRRNAVSEQKQWLSQVDEAYFSASDEEPRQLLNGTSHSTNAITDEDQSFQPTLPSPSYPQTTTPQATDSEDNQVINGLNIPYLRGILRHWSSSTDIPLERLAYTTYRAVDSDVGKVGTGEQDGAQTRTERVVVSLAGKIGGGW